MPANLPAPSTGNGKFLSRVDYKAESGRFFDAAKIKDGDAWVKHTRDLTATKMPMVFLADLRNIETGHACLSVTPPLFANFAPYAENDPMPAAPPNPPGTTSKGYPHRFSVAMRVLIYSTKLFGPDEPVRELSIMNATAMQGLNEVLGAAEVEEEFHNPDMVPLIECVEERAIKVGMKTVYKPIFVIRGWHPRPEGFEHQPKENNHEAPSAAPPAAPRAAAPTGFPQRAAPSGRPLDDDLDVIPF